MDIDLRSIEWNRIALNSLMVLCLVFAADWGSQDNLFLALKAAGIAALVAFARELQEVLQGKNGPGDQVNVFGEAPAPAETPPAASKVNLRNLFFF